jgi:MASE1
VVIAPVILLWATVSLRSFSGLSLTDTLATLLVSSAIGVAAYSPSSDLPDLFPYRAAVGFLILLPLMWAGLRGNQRDAATAALIFCACFVWGFSAGDGPSSAEVLTGSLFLLLPLFISTSLAPLMLGAIINAHRDTEARLLSAQLLLKLQFDQTKLAFKNAKRHFQIFIEGVADYAIFVLDPSGGVEPARDQELGQRGRLFSCVEALPPDQAALASRTSASGCALR